MKILSSLIHSHVIPNLNHFFFYVEDKRRYSKECRPNNIGSHWIPACEQKNKQI